MTERDTTPPLTVFQHDFRQQMRWAWRVLWRGKLLVLACLMLAVVPTVLLLQQTKPRYTAETRVMVEAAEARDVLSERAAFTRPWLTETVVQTEADLITSTMLARRVVERLRLNEDPEFNGALRAPRPLDTFLAMLNPLSWIPGDKVDVELEAMPASARADVETARIVRAFLSRLTVRAQRRTYIISVQFTSESREKAALIANTVAEMYVVDRLEASFEDARRVTSWLGERLETLRRDVVVAEGAVEEYRAQHGLRRKGERQVTVTDQQLSELNSRLVIARSDLAQKQARLDQVRQLVRSRGSVETATDVLQSPLIQRLREQETIRQREMSEALKVYGERHPRILGFRADLNEVRNKIALEIEKIASSVANEVEVATAGVRSLERELEAVRRQVDVAGEAEIRLRELERQSEASRSLYEAFLARFKREAEQERMQRANARIVSPADIPMAPSYPRKSATITMVALLGLAVGVALVFLIDRMDNAIRSADEAEELTGVPSLAMIPLHRGGGERPIDDILRRPRSALADAVRSVRTSLDLADQGTAPVVMITSSMPKEGKTFVSLCLALMYARGGQRVLLIDGDVHRPRLHSAIGVAGEVGLAQVLSGEAAADDVIQRGIADAFDFLPAGSAANVSELIRGASLETLRDELLKHYDRIVIDSPPVLAVADTRVLARLAHRLIYLVRWNSTPRDAVRNGFKLLRGAGVSVHGVALSQVNQRKHSRYGYGDYGQYYGRYRDYYAE